MQQVSHVTSVFDGSIPLGSLMDLMFSALLIFGSKKPVQALESLRHQPSKQQGFGHLRWPSYCFAHTVYNSQQANLTSQTTFIHTSVTYLLTCKSFLCCAGAGEDDAESQSRSLLSADKAQHGGWGGHSGGHYDYSECFLVYWC